MDSSLNTNNKFLVNRLVGRQDGSRVMINCMPQPVWVAFLADKVPCLIHLGFTSPLHIQGNNLRIQSVLQEE
jgi:hypothetical protein